MKELHSEIEINAPAQRVWEVLTDFASYPQWNPFIRRASGVPTAPCGDVAPPIDGTWGCSLRRPPKEDRGHPQAHVRLSKATWGNIIATRYIPAKSTVEALVLPLFGQFLSAVRE